MMLRDHGLLEIWIRKLGFSEYEFESVGKNRKVSSCRDSDTKWKINQMLNFSKCILCKSITEEVSICRQRNLEVDQMSYQAEWLRKSYWTINPSSRFSWNLRKLIGLKELVRPLLKKKLGDGHNTYFWLDNWTDLGPLIGRTRTPTTAYSISRQSK
ncbi:PREDICTED: uncharacterized protein LOC104826166 isoform X1 [Tarenaya hassleriana]|uniref:uncharacterized protein LOC104826166 isoform X1 n=1 Tax=Tarenaya hassleriana TaxID=28532 RepID=UPI00053C14A3|nr:PREDICTED: uncharacterized protein LOC104826166 isoform X1 [Tarenaya hassleriana]